MKKTVYSGLSTKCLIMTSCVMERQPYNEDRAKKVMEWFLRSSLGNYIGTTNSIYMTMAQNINPILAETKIITYNNEQLFLNTYIIVYKLPEKTSRDVVTTYMNRSLRNLQFPTNEEMGDPIVGLFKIIGGDGGYSSKLIVHENVTRQSEELIGWFCHRSQNPTKHEYAVLGISTDAIGYNKYSGTNSHYYGSLPQYQIEVAIYDNSADAINEKGGFWVKTTHLSTFSQDYGMAPNIHKCKLKAYLYKGVLIVGDNTTGITSIKDRIEAMPELINNADMVAVNQYSLIASNNGCLFSSSVGSGINHNTIRFRCLTLLLMNKDKIIEASPNIRPNDRSLDGMLIYTKNKMQKLQFRISVIRGLDTVYSMGESVFVIPFEKDKDTHLLALELLHTYLASGLQEGMKDRYFYNLLLKEDQTVKDDVLMDWFRKCSATAKSDEEKLRDAYQKLKQGLVEEYQSIEKYLAANNFGDKKPVPAVRLEEEFAKSPLKKLAFDFEKEIITDINFTRLDKAIENKFITLKYIIPWTDRRMTKGFVKGQVPLAKFYDKVNNVVVLNSQKIVKEHIERMGR